MFVFLFIVTSLCFFPALVWTHERTPVNITARYSWKHVCSQIFTVWVQTTGNEGRGVETVSGVRHKRSFAVSLTVFVIFKHV